MGLLLLKPAGYQELARNTFVIITRLSTEQQIRSKAVLASCFLCLVVLLSNS